MKPSIVRTAQWRDVDVPPARRSLGGRTKGFEPGSLTRAGLVDRSFNRLARFSRPQIAPLLARNCAKIVNFHRALTVAVHVIDRPGRTDDLDAVRTLIEDRGEHFIGRSRESVGDARK